MQGVLFDLPEPTEKPSTELKYKPRVYHKTPRPEHKPYEPSHICLETDYQLQEYWEEIGVYLNWVKLYGGFSDFLSQRSTDPKLQKARIFRWEGKDIKVPAYHFREFEPSGAVYNAFLPLYRKHLLGWTTQHFKGHKWDQDFITKHIKGEKC